MQEIPRAFSKRTGWPASGKCALVTSVTHGTEWPVDFQITEEGGGDRIAFSIGHGWAKFLVDQNVQRDTTIVFEYLDDNSLAVTLYHPLSPTVTVPEGEDGPPRRGSASSRALDEIEDVKSVYFTVSMFTESQRNCLVRAP